MKTLKKIINIIEEFLYKIFVVFSKGFFFYFSLLAGLLEKVFPLSIFKNMKSYFTKKQSDASAFLILVMFFLLGVNVYIRFCDNSNGVTKVSSSTLNNQLVGTEVSKLDEKELNLYKRYAKLDINSVSLKELKETNGEVSSWITVDGTNINYPVVHTNNNDYYLNHDINKNVKLSGWIFMDYRNSEDMSDNNTIFYGHNLANKTAFGSLDNVFKEDWLENSNHYIVVMNEHGKYIYEVFSVYTADPEVYYLQSNFEDSDYYYEFLKTIRERSVYDFKIELKKTDRIITLSTCTSDNKHRYVVHARLV